MTRTSFAIVALATGLALLTGCGEHEKPERTTPPSDKSADNQRLQAENEWLREQLEASKNRVAELELRVKALESPATEALAGPIPVPSGTDGAEASARTPPSIAADLHEYRFEMNDDQAIITLPGGVKLELVKIPPGEFMMGGTVRGQPWEKPSHHVVITKHLLVGRYEVTQQQWFAVMQDWRVDPPVRGASLPIGAVSWADAQLFLSRLAEGVGRDDVTFTLPSEAMWEYCCRAGTTTEWHFGDKDTNFADFGWWSGNSGLALHPVGQKSPNPWGLYDMYGNVAEWCLDWYSESYYPESPEIDPPGPSVGTHRVLRGGNFGSDIPKTCSSIHRHADSPDGQNPRSGLRVFAMLNQTAPGDNVHP